MGLLLHPFGVLSEMLTDTMLGLLVHLTVGHWSVVLHLEGIKVFEAMLAADFEAWNKLESRTFSQGQRVRLTLG